jgi:nucleotide-binding universal stress UspA family protein
MKILIAADGSDYTKRAVDYVIRHLDILRANPVIHLLHVQPPLPGRAKSFVSRKVVQAYQLSESRRALRTAARLLGRVKMPFRERHMVGDPGYAIASLAASGKYDLVIMGSHGYGALRNLVLGSVASKVLATCAVPVLIVR